MSLGEAIRRIREDLGETQEGLALLLGIARNTLSQYETGKLIPSYRVLAKLYRYADGEEENAAILQAVRAQDRSQRPVDEGDVRDALAILDRNEAGAQAGPPKTTLKHVGLRAEFARLAKGILEGEIPIDRNVLEIVQLWAEHGHNRRLAAHFREVASYLKVMLTISEARPSGVGLKSPRKRRPL